MRKQTSGSVSVATKLGVSILAGLILAYLSGCGKPTGSGESSAAGKSVVGQRIEFKQGGGSEPYRVSGWSQTEEKFTWSEGTSAKLQLPVGSDGGPWVLKVTVAGLINPPDLPAQPVEVYANDKKIADWQVGNTADFSAPIPESVNKAGGKLDLEFRIPKATSPKAIGQNSDPRILGICVHAIELAKG